MTARSPGWSTCVLKALRCARPKRGRGASDAAAALHPSCARPPRKPLKPLKIIVSGMLLPHSSGGRSTASTRASLAEGESAPRCWRTRRSRPPSPPTRCSPPSPCWPPAAQAGRPAAARPSSETNGSAATTSGVRDPSPHTSSLTVIAARRRWHSAIRAAAMRMMLRRDTAGQSAICPPHD